MFGFDDENDQMGGGLLGPQQQQQPGGMDERSMRLLMLGQLVSSRGNIGGMLPQVMAMQKMQQQRAQQAQLAGIFQGGQQQPPAQNNPSAYVAPETGNAPAMRLADAYERASVFYATMGDSESAKRYADIAAAKRAALQPEFGAPQTVMVGGKPTLVQFDKQGNMRPVQGAQPKPELTTPFATADGMASMDQQTGDVRQLGVQPPEAAAPNEVREYQFAQQQGYKGSFDQFRLAKAQAGASRVTVSPQIKVGNTLGEKVAAGVAERTMNDIQGGDAALDALSQIDTVRQNVDQAIVGPGNEPRTVLARLKSLVGLGGNATKEQLEATAKTAQALASAQLTAAQAMKGQGQITEKERAILENAANGKMGNSAEEIRAATEVMEKVARLRITQAQKSATAIKKIPDFAPLFPFADGRLANVPPGGPQIAPLKGRSTKGKVTNQPGQKTVTRTGMLNGRRVVQYSDGTTAYAD